MLYGHMIKTRKNPETNQAIRKKPWSPEPGNQKAAGLHFVTPFLN